MRQLTREEVELFHRAREVLEGSFHPEIHQVAAAARTGDGQVFVGLHIGSRRINVCAESSAFANVEIANAGPVLSMVAVCKDEAGRVVVTNPCGVCRELMQQYAPDAQVIVDHGGEVRSVPSASLIPTPWRFPHETAWTVEEPSEGEE
ncbi:MULTISPECIES: cytidine deaminase [unclassified Nocardioides]|uniref:cytidine deaminase n=1 Tax=unclassified Nocardioides TaxID=2615069 RepID=UPI0000571E76|nr:MULTISPECIES: cytidine deaminase [unclassified Nocardioides]ABL83688.1 CMP/dCMP deaminase, zinc-binding protein [Nocardioides sp. JS614]